MNKVNWSKLKIPPIGMSDGMVEFLNRGKKVKKIKQVKEIALVNSKEFPRYVKYTQEHSYVKYWIGDLEVGNIYRPEDFPKQQAYWERALFSIAKECFEISDKTSWNLSRDHSVEIKKPFVWSWESYNQSIEKRKLELEKRQALQMIGV